MSRLEIIFSEPDLHWIELDDGEVVARGDIANLRDRDPDRTRIYVPPLNDVILTPVEFADLAPAQAQAAARLLIADVSLIPESDLHIICSDDGLVAANASRADVAKWVAEHDPDIILPAPMLLPSRDAEVQVATLGSVKFARGPNFAGPWDEAITPLIVGDAPIHALNGAEFDAAMIAGTATPAMNLRHGDFERRTRFSLDGGLMRVVGVMVAALLFLTLLIPLVTMMRLNAQSDTLEQTSRTAAQTSVGANVPEDQALAQLDTRLAALRGGGAGFVKTSAAVILAVQATPNVELTMMAFTPDGQLRTSLRATKPEEIDLAAARMRALGLEVERGPINPAQGQPVVELKVKGR